MNGVEPLADGGRGEHAGRAAGWRGVARWATVAARVVLGAVLLVSGLAKLGDPDAAERAVRAYELVPEWAVGLFAWGLPAVEVALAVLLVAGLAPRVAAWASFGVLLVFVAGIVSAAARGLQIDCGCFGGGGETAETTYLLDLVRDVALLGVALVAALGPADPLRARSLLPARWRGGTGQVVVTAAVLVVALGVGVLVQGQRAAPSVDDVAVPEAEAPTVEGTPWLVGDPGAPVVVEVYEDLTCASCRDLHAEAEPALEPFLDDGTAVLAVHPMAVHGEGATRAAAAVACAHDAGGFAPYRDAVFAAQDGDAELSASRLVAIGRSVGLADAGFASCVEAGTYLDWVRAEADAGSRRGVVLTPTVFVDGELVRPPVTAEALARAVARAGRGTDPGSSPSATG